MSRSGSSTEEEKEEHSWKTTRAIHLLNMSDFFLSIHTFGETYLDSDANATSDALTTKG